MVTWFSATPELSGRVHPERLCTRRWVLRERSWAGSWCIPSPNGKRRSNGGSRATIPSTSGIFVRTVTRPIAWLYAGFTLLALVSLGALLAMCASSLLTSGFRGVGFNAALLAVWLATYCGFFTFWDPSNPDFWVVQVFLTPLLVVAVLARIPPNGLETSLLLVLAVSLLVVNGLGTVRLARDPANDYYTVYLRSVARELRSGDVLILGDHWPIRAHLDRHAIATLFLSVEISRTGSVDLARASSFAHGKRHSGSSWRQTSWRCRA